MSKALAALVLAGAILAARGETPAAFGRRCIPPGCVAPSSNTPGILGRRALPAGRLTGLGATLAFHHGLLAQGPQPPTFRARADLVQVDVVVVDANGEPVRGLKAADFALFDRKQRQAIVNFDEVSHARPAAATGAAVRLPLVAQDVSSNQTVQSGRLVVMVIDDLHIYKERTTRAREIATRVLEDLGHQSSMAVLFTSGEHSTQVTQDRVRLAAAVGTLKGRQ